MQTRIKHGSGCIFYLYVQNNVLITFNVKFEHFTAGSEGLLWGKTDNLLNCLLKGNLYTHAHFISACSWICVLQTMLSVLCIASKQFLFAPILASPVIKLL